MSDDMSIEFEGGIFDDAGVELNAIPDDPFDFGQEFWPIYVTELGDVKVTKNGDKVGMMIKWAVDHPKYEDHPVSKKLGNGNWQQLPVPRALQGEIPWSPKTDPDHKKVLIDLRDLYLALGFSIDQMGRVKPSDLLGKHCQAKIKPVKTPEGFWQFNIYAHKPFEASDGATSPGANGGGLSEAEMLKKELGDI